ncbi:MAG: rhodanese-like domain-containing protein [Flavobacteriaceae bacterium]|nr:rhodanese-like domain-containing protein [Flavobacteriaceae bacterium]
MIKNVRVGDLPQYIEKNALFIDVREEYEQPKFNFANHKTIPTSELADRLSEIPKQGDVLIYCHSGGRSADVVATLNLHYGYDNLLNVVGGAITMAVALPELL